MNAESIATISMWVDIVFIKNLPGTLHPGGGDGVFPKRTTWVE